MSRDLTSGMVTAITAKTVTPVLLAYFDFSSGAVRVWSGIGDIVWGGNTYSGVGNFGGVSDIAETQDNSAQGAMFTLNGIPSSLIYTALTEHYQGRAAKLWLGVMDSTMALIADPYLLFGGRMDVMTSTDSGETASLTLAVENRLIDLNRSRERRYTDEDQKIDYPADTGLRYIAGLQDKTIQWGSGVNQGGDAVPNTDDGSSGGSDSYGRGGQIGGGGSGDSSLNENDGSISDGGYYSRGSR